MSYSNDITEQYLNKIYEDLQKEQFRLLNDIKSGTTEDKQSSVTKQITLINTINLAVMKLRNIRRKTDI